MGRHSRFEDSEGGYPSGTKPVEELPPIPPAWRAPETTTTSQDTGDK
jgi:hypothetical protein